VWVVTLNGSTTGPLSAGLEGDAEYLHWMLKSLDGARRYAWSIWQTPPGVPLDRVNMKRFPQEYLQCAGTHERMTVEVRRREVDGAFRQYALARPGVEAGGEEVIRWDAFETVVCSNEVFDAEAAFPVFLAYFTEGNVPNEYPLRLLELGGEPLR